MAFDRVVPGKRRAAVQCGCELAVCDARASFQDIGAQIRKRDRVLDAILCACRWQGPKLLIDVDFASRHARDFTPSLAGQDQKLDKTTVRPFKDVRSLPNGLQLVVG